jgi:putative FmdB family regulatory protein
MPLFEYECHACARKFEFLQRGSETAKCPQCGTEDLEKCLSVFAVSTRSAPASQPSAGACASCPHAGGCGVN